MCDCIGEIRSCSGNYVHERTDYLLVEGDVIYPLFRESYVTPGVLTQTYTKVSKMIGRHVRLTLRVLSKRSIIDESNLAILIRVGFR